MWNGNNTIFMNLMMILTTVSYFSIEYIPLYSQQQDKSLPVSTTTWYDYKIKHLSAVIHVVIFNERKDLIILF